MSGRGRCTTCGAINRDDATFCTQCFSRNPFLGSSEPAAATVTTPATAAFATPAPAIAGVGAFGYPFSEPSEPAPARATSDFEPVRWRWKHLSMFYAAVWILPVVLNLFLPPTAFKVSAFLDRAMLMQIVGYLIGGFVLWSLVVNHGDNDWTTVGGKKFDGRELLFGALLGLGLIAAVIPIGIALNQGEFGVDPMVRLLVGGASGFGVFLAAIVIGIGAPVIEEVFFRGIMFEKLRRLSMWVAIPVTAVLFTLAHGALLIPAILLMGFVLGFVRRKKSIWFTMGTHSAWNFSILFIAVVLMGGSFTHGTTEDPFSLTYPNTWHESDEARDVIGPRPEIVLASPSGSIAAFDYKKTRWPNAELTLKAMWDRIFGVGYSSIGPGQYDIKPIDVDFGAIVQGYEATIHGPSLAGDQPMAVTLLVVQRMTSKNALVAVFGCHEAACADEGAEFDEMLGSIRLFDW